MHIQNDPSFFLSNKTGYPRAQSIRCPCTGAAPGTNQFETPLFESEVEVDYQVSSGILRAQSLELLGMMACVNLGAKCKWTQTSIGTLVVVSICMSASTILGQMANLFTVIAPRPGLCSASYSAVVGFDCSWKDHHTFFSFLPDVQHRHGSSHPSTQLPRYTFQFLSISSGKPSRITSKIYLSDHHFLSCCPWHGAELLQECGLNMGIPTPVRQRLVRVQ
ncbi:hypothetical protein Tco_0318752 [Tanacetum coccineum]